MISERAPAGINSRRESANVIFISGDWIRVALVACQTEAVTEFVLSDPPLIRCS
jgi:hypothetical protein